MVGLNLNILIERTVNWIYFSSMPVNMIKSKLNASGQAAVEYLLTLTAVFIAFAGVSILFSNQVDHYLSLLFDLIVLPF
jgi:hypothetical protein